MFDTQNKKVALKCLGTSKMQFWHIIVKMTHIAKFLLTYLSNMAQKRFFLPDLDIEKLACKILKKKAWPYIICNETLVQVFKVEITTYNTFIIFN